MSECQSVTRLAYQESMRPRTDKPDMKAYTVTASPPPKGKYCIWYIDTLMLFPNTIIEPEIKIR